ncbi:MAG: hypothetical protein ABR526_12235, partial [Chthoniobacterales bacterium]
MRNHTPSESGFTIPRLLAAFILCVSSAMLAVLAFASTPSSGTLSDTTPLLTYTAGPFNTPNQTPVPLVDKGPTCNGTTNPCDSYALTLSLPAGYVTTNPNASIKVTMSWKDTGSGQSDYDFYAYKGTVGNTTSSTTPDAGRAASSANPEVASIGNLVEGTSNYTFKIVPYQPTGETVTVRIELIAGAAGPAVSAQPPFGGPTATAPGVPRYQVFVPPTGSSAETKSGEFNIGFNPKTGRIMAMNIGPILRLTPPERLTPAKPECCEALWEDKSAASTSTGLDPILFTDRVSGRTFASNSTAGANAGYAYTDNDGDLYVPIGFAPPSGADHQTIGTGPYPATLSVLKDPVNQGQFVLYCSQDLVGSLCQRSDDLGSSYGPAVPATGPGTNASKGCGGLHGHVHIAANGTAWLPDKSCGTKQGGGISKDGDTTPWTEFVVEGTNDVKGGAPFTTVKQADGADPSVALDADSRAYFAYVNSEANGVEGHVHVAVSENNGTSWVRDVDIGLPVGIKNAAHVEAVGGSSGRAAVGFFGTNKAGSDYEEPGFPGVWYAFI